MFKSDLSKSKSSQKWHLLCRASQRFPFFPCLLGRPPSPAMFKQVRQLAQTVAHHPLAVNHLPEQMAEEQGKMVSKQLCPSARLHAPGPGNGGLVGSVWDSLTANTAASRHSSLYSWSMRVAARTAFPGGSMPSHKRPSGSRGARTTQESLKVIMEKAILSLELAGFVGFDKNNCYPDSSYIVGESACVTER